MAGAEFPGSLNNLKSQASLNNAFRYYLSLAYTKRAVFCDVGNLIFDRGEKAALAVKLTPACSGKMNVLFLQTKDQVENFRVNLLGSVS